MAVSTTANPLLMPDIRKTVLLLESFYGGSHRQLIDLLHEELPAADLYTLPAKKWPWRSRTSALYLSQIIPEAHDYQVLFCSSVLNLAELVALRPDLANLRKIVYFHENQLVYPVRKQQDRDFQYGYNQILTSLVADAVIFNSVYNQESFLNNINTFLKTIPDHRPKGLDKKIRPKCRVIYFPIRFPESAVEPVSGETHQRVQVEDGETSKSCEQIAQSSERSMCYKPLVITWCHRWEHDKNPELLFETLYKLADEGFDFRVAIMGETFTDVPVIFSEAHTRLGDRITCWGYQASKGDYYRVLRDCDVSISTARHEFYGVAMLESVHFGCYPLVPNRLVYPEIFPVECLYNTDNQLLKQLRRFCQAPHFVRARQVKIDMTRFAWHHLQSEYKDLLCIRTPQDLGRNIDESTSKNNRTELSPHTASAAQCHHKS